MAVAGDAAMEAADIINRLPHRYPFLMVDRVLEVLPGVRAVGVLNVTGGRLPEILLLEAMAQLSALAAPALNGPGTGEAPVSGYLAGINGARFAGYPQAGDRVILKVEFEARMGGLVRFKGTASIDDNVVVESSLTFTLPGGG
jgi:3-hydroxyacyl-[acyl-carrier-protein] dehydratase